MTARCLVESPEKTAMPTPALASSSTRSCGGALVAADGRTLPLRAVSITGDAGGGLARVVVEQRFHNAHDVPLTVTYSLPIPVDAAVGGYEFRIGDRRIVGEVDKRERARERYEEAILEGKTAALLDQERSSLFTQELGNVPPGHEVVAQITLDQRLRWLDEGLWEWRFPTTVSPRYLGPEGRVADAARVTQDVAESVPVRATLSLSLRDALPAGRAPESPSHRLHVESGQIAFADETGAAIDRDVVVRWAVARVAVGLTAEVARATEGSALADDAFALLTIVPPEPSSRPQAVARDVTVLLDTSGSMDGAPLDQARRIVAALIDTLGERDRLELIAFSGRPERWKPAPVAATADHRRAACAWLASQRAGGGTEMHDAIIEALRPLRGDAQRQVVLVTDGQIGFEGMIVTAIAARPAQALRVHTVGVGSAVNRSLTAAAARAGRGVEVVVGVGEDVERAVQRLVARTRAPLVVDVTVSGSALLEHAPATLPDVFAGAPLLVGARLRAEGGELLVRGQTASGPWQARVSVPATQPGEGRPAVAALFGREAVEDLEIWFAAGADERETEAKIWSLGLRHRIATRFTSWVAIAEEPSVDPSVPFRRVRMPHEVPHGMSIEGLGLRAAAAGPQMMRSLPAGALALGNLDQAPMPGPTRITALVAGRRSAIASAPPAPAPRAARRLSGHAKVRGNRLDIDVLVEGADLSWSPPVDVEVMWADGSTTREVVTLTTRAAVVKDGEHLRVVLQLPASRTKPRLIEIDAGGERLLIDL
jgi:Ca-activated chloride channel family protein